jgi:amino-acid N-acetyltransferase
MSSVSIAARPSLADAVALLRAADLPTEDLTESHLEHFFCASTPDAVVGLVGLELHDRDALLRSLAVSRDARTAGIGSRLVEHIENYARSRGVGCMYLLTTTAESFFARRGYAPTERATAPATIRSTREFSTLCPASSAFMVKHLQESRR